MITVEAIIIIEFLKVIIGDVPKFQLFNLKIMIEIRRN